LVEAFPSIKSIYIQKTLSCQTLPESHNLHTEAKIPFPLAEGRFQVKRKKGRKRKKKGKKKGRKKE